MIGPAGCVSGCFSVTGGGSPTCERTTGIAGWLMSCEKERVGNAQSGSFTHPVKSQPLMPTKPTPNHCRFHPIPPPCAQTRTPHYFGVGCRISEFSRLRVIAD